MKAEYTLAQAVAMVNLIGEQWHTHFCFGGCEQCVLAEMYSDRDPTFEYCPRGKQLEDQRAKWKRRCRYAARREGVKMTI